MERIAGRKIPRENLRIEQRDAQTLSFSLFENNGVFQISPTRVRDFALTLTIQVQLAVLARVTTRDS
jgi:hypothetical protein